MGRARIAKVLGRRVWDSRGRPTVEAEVHLAGGAWGRAIAPAGASMGSGEALDLRDGGEAFGGLDTRRAVANLNGEIAGALSGYGLMASNVAGELVAAHATGATLPPYAPAFTLARYDDPAYTALLDTWGDSGQL